MTLARGPPRPWVRATRFWNTVRFLDVSQLAWRLQRRAFQARPRPIVGVTQAATRSSWVRPVPKVAAWLTPERFSCHGGEWQIMRGRPWRPPSMPALDVYHLHYLDDLSTSEVLDEPALGAPLAARWLADNVAEPAEAWQPYPLSRRIVNLCKWHLAGGSWWPEMLASVASQADLLCRCVEYDIRGNHLIANGAALTLSGTVLEGTLANRCASLGLRILTGAVRRQILPDGGHYERSPMYHAVVLEDLLDVINVLGGAATADAAPFVPVIQRMLRWLDDLTLPDGRIALFNDATFDGCRSTAALSDYAHRLGVALLPPPADAIRVLRDSGYARLASGRWTLLADVGPVGPDEQAGHAHADTLSFELALGARRVIVDPGTSSYEEGPGRALERGTRLHNTVCVDGADSSEVWGQFRTARRARTAILSATSEAGGLELAARHDGYARRRPRTLHTRRWSVRPARIDIGDLLDGSGERGLELGLLLAPETSVSRDSDGLFRVNVGADELRIRMPPGLSAQIEPATWSPAFGRREPTSRIVAVGRRRLPVTLESSIELLASPTP